MRPNPPRTSPNRPISKASKASLRTTSTTLRRRRSSTSTSNARRTTTAGRCPEHRRRSRPMRVIDLMHLDRPRVIGCWQVDDVLVDPGPESCLPTLLQALGGEQPRALLLTHIHLDHAGATGALVERWPDLEVYVHKRGAPHLIDPSRLMES